MGVFIAYISYLRCGSHLERMSPTLRIFDILSVYCISPNLVVSLTLIEYLGRISLTLGVNQGFSLILNFVLFQKGVRSSTVRVK